MAITSVSTLPGEKASAARMRTAHKPVTYSRSSNTTSPWRRSHRETDTAAA